MEVESQHSASVRQDGEEDGREEECLARGESLHGGGDRKKIVESENVRGIRDAAPLYILNVHWKGGRQCVQVYQALFV